MTNKLISKEPLFETWVELHNDAKKTSEYKTYKWFLREVQKEFTKLYAEVTSKEGVKLVESILKEASCQIKKINIKYKESK